MLLVLFHTVTSQLQNAEEIGGNRVVTDAAGLTGAIREGEGGDGLVNYPALMRLDAMGAPMIPSPRNPTFPWNSTPPPPARKIPPSATG